MNAELGFRNDFDNLILDRQASGSLGVGYNLDSHNVVGATVTRTYGDSKQDSVMFGLTTKF